VCPTPWFPNVLPPLSLRAVQIVLGNPNMDFQVDPNGFVMPVKRQPKPAGAPPAPSAEVQRAAAAAELAAASGGLFGHLLASVDGAGRKKSPAPAPTPAAAVTPTARVGPEEAELAAAKADFLASAAASGYGYDGRIDDMYPAEVG